MFIHACSYLRIGTKNGFLLNEKILSSPIEKTFKKPFASVSKPKLIKACGLKTVKGKDEPQEIC